MKNFLKRCPRCHAMVSEKNFEKHLEKQHNPEVEEERLYKRLKQQEAREQKRKEGKKLIKCVQCGVAVAARNIEKHLMKAHHTKSYNLATPTKSDSKRLVKHRKKYPNATMTDMTPAQQERHLKKLLGPDHERGNDIFDKGLTVQGRAYGLGKSSKH